MAMIGPLGGKRIDEIPVLSKGAHLWGAAARRGEGSGKNTNSLGATHLRMASMKNPVILSVLRPLRTRVEILLGGRQTWLVLEPSIINGLSDDPSSTRML